jgi:hypothetical protein
VFRPEEIRDHACSRSSFTQPPDAIPVRINTLDRWREMAAPRGTVRSFSIVVVKISVVVIIHGAISFGLYLNYLAKLLSIMDVPR